MVIESFLFLASKFSPYDNTIFSPATHPPISGYPLQKRKRSFPSDFDEQRDEQSDEPALRIDPTRTDPVRTDSVRTDPIQTDSTQTVPPLIENSKSPDTSLDIKLLDLGESTEKPEVNESTVEFFVEHDSITDDNSKGRYNFYPILFFKPRSP